MVQIPQKTGSSQKVHFADSSAVENYLIRISDELSHKNGCLKKEKAIFYQWRQRF